MGKAYRKICVEGQDFQPTQYKTHWVVGDKLYIQFHVPLAPIKFLIPPNATSHMMKSGMPYGLTWSGGSLTLSDVAVVAPDIISVKVGLDTAGKNLSYIKLTRVGSICDSDDADGFFNARSGGVNRLNNYCLPFEITL